jgi:ADP-dependent NAD(P)H-hydrate dehydratase
VRESSNDRCPTIAPHCVEVTEDSLRQWPLPHPTPDGDKEERGHVLVAGGSREMPGAVILAALAAMRAGAGKLTVATGESVAQLVAQALPEARVIGLRETSAGGIREGEAARLPDNANSVVIGPGMQDEEAAARFAADAIIRFPAAKIVLDAFAMSIVSSARRKNVDSQAIVVTPHAGEMAHLTGQTKEAILSDPITVTLQQARSWNVLTALKGATTFIARPSGELWRHLGGSCGLATSGSGDVLAGVIAGLAARGASIEQATVWAVALHARAGESLETRVGPLGYLAREIPGEIPRIMGEMSRAAIDADSTS